MSKKDLHPKDYRFVVFRDDAADFAFLTRSTAKSEEQGISASENPDFFRVTSVLYR